MFTTMAEAVDWIEHAKRFTEKTDLTRMNYVCDLFNRPQQTFRSIHVGGTNGKGSTANYIKNILQEAGYKVGLFTSPYVICINERISINDEQISDTIFIQYANTLKTMWNRIFEENNDSITFFEILTLMAFLYFRDQKVDFAVIEVGIGGLLDATNVIVPEVSCITNISFDHMKQLGNTLESIAANKLGIVKRGVPLVTAEDNLDLIKQFETETQAHLSPLIRVDTSKIIDIQVGEMTAFWYRDRPYLSRLTGMHQVKNAALAIEAILIMQKMQKITIDQRNIYDGIYRTTWPGRFEIFEHRIILDGGHNPGAIATVKATINAVYPGKYVKCLFTMMKDKDYATVLTKLAEFVDELHLTQIDYHRCAEASVLYETSQHPHKYQDDNVLEAFRELRKLKTNEVLLVSGSLYLISEIRKVITN
ncbi:MAG: folylpolyglutamate synthase/dihydrofolate synthase family protein [Candidatus Izemoplasmatales bacterium]|jgi:dihydrofolate synthase/folylpolyglutamate synthase|nr:bifunctional folylpolyglutamate synthase/dihydrofolate synthase [Candidatus Izemoplasmatales bacterium]